jgi:hypothetical protein
MRYSQQDFPSYAYIPGKTPHPRRDAQGHSFGEPEPHVDSFRVDKWYTSTAYLHGIDLFNAGFYWESHEQWEAIWHAVGRAGPVANFLKGLIKLAAAGVKLLEGRPVGVERHLRRACELFAAVRPYHDTLCGLEIDRLAEVAATPEKIELMKNGSSLGIVLQPK